MSDYWDTFDKEIEELGLDAVLIEDVETWDEENSECGYCFYEDAPEGHCDHVPCLEDGLLFAKKEWLDG